jgi:hypothetical protein
LFVGPERAAHRADAPPFQRDLASGQRGAAHWLRPPCEREAREVGQDQHDSVTPARSRNGVRGMSHWFFRGDAPLYREPR